MWPLWPLASVGQPKPLPVIGILDPDVTFIFDACQRVDRATIQIVKDGKGIGTTLVEVPR